MNFIIYIIIIQLILSILIEINVYHKNKIIFKGFIEKLKNIINQRRTGW